MIRHDGADVVFIHVRLLYGVRDRMREHFSLGLFKRFFSVIIVLYDSIYAFAHGPRALFRSADRSGGNHPRLIFEKESPVFHHTTRK